jgi:hypothetical protein
MNEIHCHGCGGFIGGDPKEVAYRLPTDTVLLAAPHSGLCRCEPPVLYEAPPGYLSSPGMPSVQTGRP